jgi:hypothetical protein
MCSWEGNKGGPSTSWFSYYVCKKPRRFLLPYNWLVRALIIQYVKNLQVGVSHGVFQSQLQILDLVSLKPSPNPIVENP